MSFDDEFARLALDGGILTAEQLERCRRAQDGRSLAEVAMSEGLLDAASAGRILARISPHRLLGDLAIERGFITPEQLDEALREQRARRGETLGQILLRKRQLTAPQFLELLKEQILVTPVARHIGKYAIEGVLGEGPRGVVFRARDPEAGREVALRILQTGDGTEPELIDRILGEVRQAARLRHPNVAALYDAGREGDIIFIAIEFVAGRPLREWWVDDRPSVEKGVDALEQVARAAHAAHELGLVHGDLRPGHILMDAQGRPRIVDFGVPRVASPADDIAALGAMLAEMLRERWPVADSLREIARRAKERGYATAGELADDLRRMPPARTIPPRPATAPPDAPAVKRPAALLAGAAAVLFGLMIGASLVKEMTRRRERPLADLAALERLPAMERDGAIAGYTEDILLHPTDPVLHANRGLAYFAKREFDGAIADFRKALEVAPEDWSERRRVRALLDRCLREKH